MHEVCLKSSQNNNAYIDVDIVLRASKAGRRNADVQQPLLLHKSAANLNRTNVHALISTIFIQEPLGPALRLLRQVSLQSGQKPRSLDTSAGFQNVPYYPAARQSIRQARTLATWSRAKKIDHSRQNWQLA